MDLRAYLRLLTRHWVLITACVLVSCGAAYAMASLQTPKYASRAQLFVSTGGQDTSANGDAFSQQRMKSYAQVLQSPLVLDAVIADLNLSYTAQQVQDEMTVTVPVDTVLIEYSVRDASAGRANEIAVAVGKQFSLVVADLDSENRTSKSPVEVTTTLPPSFSNKQVSPDKPRYLMLGLLLGLAVGVAGAMLRGALDRTVRSRESVADVTEAPLLAELPAGRGPLAGAHAYRQLGAALWAVQTREPRPAVMITGPRDEATNSRAAERTAVALAQLGERVLLVRANPVGTGPDTTGTAQLGLMDVLRDLVPLDQVLQTEQLNQDSTLFVLPIGDADPSSTKLLASNRMRDLLRRLHADFEMVIIEAPPLLTCAETSALATFTGGVILFVEAKRTTAEQLSSSLDLLGNVGAPVFGVVLSHIRSRKTSRRTSRGRRARRKAAAPVSSRELRAGNLTT